MASASMDAAAQILVVDDDRTMRLLLRHALEQDGYDVAEAHDGVQALDNFISVQPDIVLMDAAMPELDGFAACASLQRLPGGENTPILMITGLNDDASVERAFTAGATDYITKPVNWAVLRQRVRRMVSERRAEHHVNYLAYHDSLTGLPNRSMFVERLEHGLTKARRNVTRLAVMFMDLDGFKLVNDTMGHDMGDLLLKAVAERLTACLRDSDTVARLGGDEFTAVLNEIENNEQVSSAAKRVLDSLSMPFMVSGREVFVGASIGVAIFPDDGEDVRALLKSADMAMYRAKESGRNHYQFYSPEMGDRVNVRMSLESSIRRALDREEFSVYYQPVVDVSSGRISSLEALVRWIHPELGIVSPADFIPLAEETGLIGPLGEWIIEDVCRQYRSWERAGVGPQRVAINLSSRQLNNPDLVRRVGDIVDDVGMSAESIIFELTENTVMQNAEGSVSMLHAFRELGIKISVDDFGTGYSSLSYLKRLPIDTLKIDRSFVFNVPQDSDDSAIVSAIVALAHSLRLDVVAEGVENEAHVAFLSRLGCDYIQGYFLGKPVSAEDTTQILSGDIQLLPPIAGSGGPEPGALVQLVR
jgi:diguanylate cyclase (GGDEF)-like protein